MDNHIIRERVAVTIDGKLVDITARARRTGTVRQLTARAVMALRGQMREWITGVEIEAETFDGAGVMSSYLRTTFVIGRKTYTGMPVFVKETKHV